MNQYLKKALIVSASVLMFLSAGVGINNVQAQRYHYRYHRRASHNKYGYWKHYRRHGRRHSYFVRYKTGYYHNGHWIRYHGHSHFVVHFRRITPKRHYHAHRVHHYHINVEGVDDGWTTNYHYYKSESAKIQHAIDVQTAKDEEAEGLDPSQVNNDQSQTDSNNTDTNDNDQSSNDSVQNNINEMNSETIADINQDREENGEQPYQESQALDRVANMRARQYAENPNTDNPHIDPNTGNYYSDEDAVQLGLANTQLGENVDDQGLGTEETYYNTYVKNHNGTDMADEANDEMLNHDSFCGNGHRNNILSPTTHYVGVGSAYNKDTDTYYLAEDFSY